VGYICPNCGEGLPEDEMCPCEAGPDEDDWPGMRATIRGPLTAELDDPRSPIREFLGERFGSGLREVQRRYRGGAWPLVVPGSETNPGTVGTAADWLLRFLVHPQPDLHLALDGSDFVPQSSPALAVALHEMCEALGIPGVTSIPAPPPESKTFPGPLPGTTIDTGLLARGCWALALLTEFYRAGPLRAANSPVARLGHADAAGLLALATPAALDQLGKIRDVFETALIPRLADRRGPWTLGPTFAGSRLVGGADADLVAAGLLLEIKTTAKKPSLGVIDLFQVISYALDFDDEYSIDAIGLFSTRYAYLSTWPLGTLLSELAHQTVALQGIRREFREMLDAHR
jgi:hypothetical protein